MIFRFITYLFLAISLSAMQYTSVTIASAQPGLTYWLNANGSHFRTFTSGTVLLADDDIPQFQTIWTATTVSSGVESAQSPVIFTTTNGFRFSEVLYYGTGTVFQSSRPNGPWTVTYTNTHGLFWWGTNPPTYQFFGQSNRNQQLKWSIRNFN